jgi:hypothetical protein
VKGKRVCRMHGGRNPGAPQGREWRMEASSMDERGRDPPQGDWRAPACSQGELVEVC